MTKTELKRVCVKPYDKDRFEVIQDKIMSLFYQITKALYHKVLKLMERVFHVFFGVFIHLLKVSILALVLSMTICV